MPRREPRAKSFSFDLLADWRPYADPPPAGSPWVYHGTATLNGTTGALAWQIGGYGIAVGAAGVVELALWERIAVTHAVRFKTAPGWETAPTLREPSTPLYGPSANWQ